MKRALLIALWFVSSPALACANAMVDGDTGETMAYTFLFGVAAVVGVGALVVMTALGLLFGGAFYLARRQEIV